MVSTPDDREDPWEGLGYSRTPQLPRPSSESPRLDTSGSQLLGKVAQKSDEEAAKPLSAHSAIDKCRRILASTRAPGPL